MAKRFGNTVNIMKSFRDEIKEKSVKLENEIAGLESNILATERAITELRNRESEVEREQFLLRRNQIEVQDEVNDSFLLEDLVIQKSNSPKKFIMRIGRSR